VKHFSYKERDNELGQAIITLRTAIGLTQAGLADLLGISRRAVGEWEAGSSYPKIEHLKLLIELGVKHEAFPTGREAEEIRILWKVTHQKILLDEQWLSALLGQQPVTSLSSKRRVDWGDALAIPTFYGRTQELALLTQWIVQENCRVVTVLGMGGIGKSALSVSVMRQMSEHFQFVIFRSLRDAPSCEELFDDCLHALSPQPLGVMPTDLEQRISLLLEQLQAFRSLLVLDNLETILQDGDTKGRFRPGFEGYGRLLRRVAETDHQSCLVLTSREKLAELRPLEGMYSPVRSLRLAGLDAVACEQLFAEKGMIGTSQDQTYLANIYGGNPLALKIVTETIIDLFSGDISQFISGGTIIFGSIADLLNEQFSRLSTLEQTVLNWLAIVREPVTIDELLAVLAKPLPRVQVFEAVDGLRRRSLIEPGKRSGSFTLQAVVLEYVTSVLIMQVTDEIQQRKPDKLVLHGLEQSGAKEYIRQTQVRLLLAPILDNLQNTYLERADGATVEQMLCSLLDLMREKIDYAQGYGPANLISLLRLLRGHLRGLDFSRLFIRGAYLQSVEMQDASLARAIIRDTIFTEALDVSWGVAISSKGTYWAAGGKRGDVHVWRGGQTLHLAWQAHADNVYSLSFSPDERTLVTGSWDGSVKLWDLESGVLLWTGWHTDTVFMVAFAPDGHMLASGGTDECVKLWDVVTGVNMQTLATLGSAVDTVAWSPDGHILAGCGSNGSIWLWQIQGKEPATCIEILKQHTNWVYGLAFSPDGLQMVSGSWDGTVKICDIASKRILQTLTGHIGRVFSVAWSPDGRVIASTGYDDKTIRLWDVVQNRYRAVLHGHTGAVYTLAFTPDSREVLSGSEDSTLRVWDVASEQCVRVMQGYAVSFRDMVWSPSGTYIATAGSDMLVTIWDIADGVQPKILHGHANAVQGVAWSPNGRFLASSGWDGTIRVWDQATGACIRVLRDLDYIDTIFYGLAWSPDGRMLASGSYLYGIQVWDMETYTSRWVGGRVDLTRIRRMSWSSDSKQLASGGDDGNICLWQATDGTLLRKFQGHQGVVADVAWSMDRTRLASAGGRENGELFVWDVHSGEIIQTFRGHPGGVLAVTWIPNGGLVSGDSNGRLHWWDVSSGQCLKTFQGHEGAIQSLRVSPDGHLLASSGDDSTIRLWNLENTMLLKTLRRDRPYERLNIVGIKGLTEAQKATLHMLGAIENL
jgi:WD40 repeat protein/transcriptional regulator with XRE-family HTH domain